jgi:precorrin-2 dehydrogenase/sirohydrochlorin ferrochelatase
MRYYPIFVNLSGKRCLIVGGSDVAARKAESLLEAGAMITIVSPKIVKEVQTLVSAGRLRYHRRPYREGDLKGHDLVIAATGIPDVDAAVAAEARQIGILFNAVDNPAICDFITPAIIRRGDLTIAISTQGKCPGFARRVRQKIESIFGPEFAVALDVAAAWRKTLLVSDAHLPFRVRRVRLESILSRVWPDSSTKGARL